MDISDTMKNVTIVSGEEQLKIRNAYCASFLNTKDDGYKENIATSHNYSDGYCYNGYMWDYLTTPTIAEEHGLIKAIEKLKKIHVLWDIHSCERIFIEDYWKFGKDNIFLLDGDILMKILHLLPEDIYIFDEKYTWTIILTHEYIDNARYCLISGDVLC